MSHASEQNRSVEEIEEEAKHIRGDLSQTLDELTHRLDVPARTREKLSDLREHGSGAIAVAGAVAALCLLLLIRRRRNSRC